jgi:hypothetical protein
VAASGGSKWRARTVIPEWPSVTATVGDQAVQVIFACWDLLAVVECAFHPYSV